MLLADSRVQLTLLAQFRDGGRVRRHGHNSFPVGRFQWGGQGRARGGGRRTLSAPGTSSNGIVAAPHSLCIPPRWADHSPHRLHSPSPEGARARIRSSALEVLGPDGAPPEHGFRPALGDAPWKFKAHGEPLARPTRALTSAAPARAGSHARPERAARRAESPNATRRADRDARATQPSRPPLSPPPKVRAFTNETPNVCDVLLVDGDHAEAGARSDLRNFRAAASPNATLVVDDIQMDPGLSLRNAERAGLLRIREVYGPYDSPSPYNSCMRGARGRLLCVPWGFAVAEYADGNADNAARLRSRRDSALAPGTASRKIEAARLAVTASRVSRRA